MNSKIKVDPRTFKIINQAQSQDQSRSQTTTDTFTSDSESGSSTSVKSDTESVKVIKLDNSVQSGGEKQTLSLPLQKNTNPNPEVKIQPIQASLTKPVVTNPTTSLPKVENNNNNNTNLFNYLSIKNTESKPEQEITLSKSVASDAESDTNENSDNIESENEPTIDEVSEDKTEVQTEKVEDESQQDIFDLTQNKLYQVLSKLFESTKGDGIGENLEKMSKLFETHNQIMEKILNQLIIMNTNYKQVKVPDVFHTSTKQAGNVPDFRKKLDQLDQKAQKKI
jgi:hypothetical protein